MGSSRPTPSSRERGAAPPTGAAPRYAGAMTGHRTTYVEQIATRPAIAGRYGATASVPIAPAGAASSVVRAELPAVVVVIDERLVELRSVLDLVLRTIDEDRLVLVIHRSEHTDRQHDLLAEDPWAGVDDECPVTRLERGVVHLADRP